uniref:Apoptosis-inducing factor 3 n=1 Tax=Petromyzon marinus TaxID=7757 RepID=A0AAJ7SM66_PETMA
PASVVCAETLRQEGFTGLVTMITREHFHPYDRPKLSKMMDTTAEAMSLRPPEFYQEHDITVLTGTEAVSVDIRSRLVTLSSGSTLAYDKLLIATGATPRVLSCPGAHLEGVFTLRSPDEANRIASMAAGANLVVVGSSFIGMEVAASLSDKAHSVSVVGSSDVPFKRTLGVLVGQAIMKLCERHGVKFYMSHEVSELRGVDGRLREVKLKSGKVLRADVCVMGIGVVPSTGFLKHSGIHLDSRGHIPLDKSLQSNVPAVYAAGDVASFPLPLRAGKRVNISHWQVAHAHGRAVGLAMMNREVEFKTVPFFWTALCGKSLRYTGYGDGFEDVLIQGDLDELRFIAYYIKNEDVVAVASMNWDPVVSHFAEVMNSGGTVTRRDVESSDLPWVKEHEQMKF